MSNKTTNEIIKSIVNSSDREFYENCVVLSYQDNEFNFYLNTSSSDDIEFYNTTTLEDYDTTEKQDQLIKELANDIFNERQKEVRGIINYREEGF